MFTTAAQSLAEQRRVGGALRGRGLAPGDRLALLVPGSTRMVSVVLGALRVGVVPVPLDPRLTAYEREALLTDLTPALVVDDVSRLDALVDDGHEVDLAEWPLARPMHVTSGTTGRPKGVWSGVLSPADARALAEEERSLWGFTASDRHLVLSPLHHSAPLRFAVGTLLAGGGLVVPGPFEPARVTSAIVQHRPTTTFCVPAHLQRLFTHLDEAPAEKVPDLSCFRLVAHAGAPCPPAVKRRAVEAFGRDVVWEFYGSTEGQFTACSASEWLQRPGTVGRARPGRRLFVDDGVVWCTVPGHARFVYWNAPDKTSAAWRETPDGPAFTVGDLGRLDEDGYLFLDGRREDLIISGGVNVYPVEVEDALGEHPGVEEIAVFGLPDEHWGHRVCAAVVGDVDPEDLDAWARERLSPPKRPKEYVAVEALPRTTTGKVRRMDLPGLAGGSSQACENVRR